MNICFINFGHLDATFPLAKRLAENNNVTIFCIFYDGFRNMDAIDLTNKIIEEGVINNKNSLKYLDSELVKYINNKFSVNIVFFKTLDTNKFSFYQTLLKLRKMVISITPDIINFIGHSYFLKMIHLSLWNYPRVHTVHEVNAHNGNEDFSQSINLIQFLVNKKQYFIFPSKVTTERFHKSFKLEKNNTTQIYFGKFELYKLFEDISVIPEKTTVLFLGKIVKYKGLEYLIEAAQICGKKIPNFKLIIAGKGDIGSLNISGDMSFIQIVNRSLTNAEVANYIQRSSLVVCPYTSASSSGIPLSSYVFNKPVIASNVEGLNECVFHMETGLLVSAKDSNALAEAIEKLLLDETLYNKIVFNLNADRFNREIDWQVITKKTFSFYNKVIRESKNKNNNSLSKHNDIFRTGIAALSDKKKELSERVRRKTKELFYH